MAVGGVSSSTEFIQVSTELTQSMQQYGQFNATLARMRADSTYSRDQIVSFARYAQAVGNQITKLTERLADLTYSLLSGMPRIPPPIGQSPADAGQNLAALRSNGWLAPSAVMAFMLAMQYYLKIEMENAGMEGQNAAKGMVSQQKIGDAEAAKQRKQGDLEFRKGIAQACIEAVSALMQFGTATMRLRSAYKSGASTGDKAAQEKVATNQKTIDRNKAQIQLMQQEIREGTAPNQAQVADAEIPPAGAITPQRKADLEQRIATKQQENAALEEQNIKTIETSKYQQQEHLRHEMATWEQFGRGMEHLGGTANKLTEAFFGKQIKYIEAEMTILRTHGEILRNYNQSAAKAAAESHQNAQDAVKAMDSFFQSRSQAYWARFRA